MCKAELSSSALDLVAVTTGPGSFTGIRVGLAAARGIALVTRAQLIGVTCFGAVAARLAPPAYDFGARFLLIALESRRQDLYIQLFDHAQNPLGDPAPVMAAALGETLSGIIGAAPLLVAGDAAQRAAGMLSGRPGTVVVEESAPDATGVLLASLRRWRLGERGDKPAPFYLRPPDVTYSTARR